MLWHRRYLVEGEGPMLRSLDSRVAKAVWPAESARYCDSRINFIERILIDLVGASLSIVRRSGQTKTAAVSEEEPKHSPN